MAAAAAVVSTRRTRSKAVKVLLSVETFELIVNQVTLQTPQNHEGTLLFYSEQHYGKYDWERYVPDAFNEFPVRHLLYWILASIIAGEQIETINGVKIR